MGWWAAPDANNIEVGDEVLDEIRHFLIGFGKIYQKDLKRKPTLAEFEYAINLAFKTNVDNDVLADFDELEIKQVVVKTGKISKRTKVKPGDIFSFKIANEKFGFGRIVSVVSIGAVVEIFNYFSRQPVFDPTKIEDWLISPVTIGTHPLFEARTEGDWRVVGETKDFSPGSKYEGIRFIYGDEDDGFFTAVDVFDKESKIGVAEGKNSPFTPYEEIKISRIWFSRP